MMFFPSNPPENPGPSVPWPLCRYYWAVNLHGALQRARKRRVPSNAPCPSAASQWLHRWHTPRQRPSHPRFHLQLIPWKSKTIKDNSLLEVLIVYKSLPKKMIFLEKPLNGMVFGPPGLIHFGLKSATSTLEQRRRKNRCLGPSCCYSCYMLLCLVLPVAISNWMSLGRSHRARTAHLGPNDAERHDTVPWAPAAFS